MIKRLAAYFKNYKLPAILCPVLMLFEVMGDVAMPWLMAQILNRVDVSRAAEFTTADIYYVLKIGGLMVLVSLIAMFCGAYSSRRLPGRRSGAAGGPFCKNTEIFLFKYRLFQYPIADYAPYDGRQQSPANGDDVSAHACPFSVYVPVCADHVDLDSCGACLRIFDRDSAADHSGRGDYEKGAPAFYGVSG